MLKGINFVSGLNTTATGRPYRRVQRPRLPIKTLKLWHFDNIISEFLEYLHCACTQTAIWKLPVKNLT